MKLILPMPEKEMERLLALTDFDLDYSNLQENFKDLTKLAAKVSGTDISLVNLIDSYTQWTVSSHGLLLEQMPREESVCQYTICESESFEVSDLKEDNRFKDKFYVQSNPGLRYYFGVPLKSDDGHNLGALCVLDKSPKTLQPEKIELLTIIADEIVNRINSIKVIELLKVKAKESRDTKLKIAHDIRGPLNGIIGLAQIVSEQGDKNKLEDVLNFVNLIQRSSHSILDLADEILRSEKKQLTKTELKQSELNLLAFKEKLEKLYLPQTITKKLEFTINTSAGSDTIPFLKNKLLQITGNLLSNAIKFTPVNGKINIDLGLVVNKEDHALHIRISDTGVGLLPATIDHILSGNTNTTEGTNGEQGYGFGLSLVMHLIKSMNGTCTIESKMGEGSVFNIVLPKMQL